MEFNPENITPVKNEAGEIISYKVADKDAFKSALEKQEMYMLSKNERDRMISNAAGHSNELKTKVDTLEQERVKLQNDLQALQEKALNAGNTEELSRLKEQHSLAQEQIKAKDAQLSTIQKEYKEKEQRLELENSLSSIRVKYSKDFTDNEAWSAQIKIAEQNAIAHLQTLEEIEGVGYKRDGVFLVDESGKALTKESILSEQLKIFVAQPKSAGLPSNREKTSHGKTTVTVDYSAIPTNNMVAFSNALAAKGIYQGTDEYKIHFLNWKSN